MLKIANVLVLYVVKSLTSKQDDGDPCPLNAMGSQFFFLILTDLTVIYLSYTLTHAARGLGADTLIN